MDQQNDITEGQSIYMEAKKKHRDDMFKKKLTPSIETDIIILRHLVNGQTTKEIGKSMFKSPRTIEFRVQNIMRVLNCKNHAQLAAVAVRKKIVD